MCHVVINDCHIVCSPKPSELTTMYLQIAHKYPLDETYLVLLIREAHIL